MKEAEFAELESPIGNRKRDWLRLTVDACTSNQREQQYTFHCLIIALIRTSRSVWLWHRNKAGSFRGMNVWTRYFTGAVWSGWLFEEAHDFLTAPRLFRKVDGGYQFPPVLSHAQNRIGDGFACFRRIIAHPTWVACPFAVSLFVPQNKLVPLCCLRHGFSVLRSFDGRVYGIRSEMRCSG